MSNLSRQDQEIYYREVKHIIKLINYNHNEVLKEQEMKRTVRRQQDANMNGEDSEDSDEMPSYGGRDDIDLYPHQNVMLHKVDGRFQNVR